MDLCARLPWWEAWLGPGLASVLGLLLSFGTLELVRARARRSLGDPSPHWTERARMSLELKSLALVVGVFCVGAIGSWHVTFKSASGCSRENLLMFASATVATVLLFRTLGAIDAEYRGSAHGVGARLKSIAALFVLLYPGLLVVIALNLANSIAPMDARVWAWVGLAAALHVLVGTGVLERLARPLGLAWPAGAKVAEAVERARRDLPTEVERVDEIAWLMPNALAFPFQKSVAFTKPAADSMSSDDLHAIALHELGHLHETAAVRWFRAIRGLVLLPLSVGVPLLVSGRSGALLGLVVACFVLAVVGVWASKRHESDADAHAKEHSQTYARALESLYRLAGIPAVLSKHTTHPSLYDRMVSAGVQPDFPRPAPPRRLVAILVGVAMCATLIVTTLGVALARRPVATSLGRERGALVRVAFGGSPRDLMRLSRATPDRTLARLLREKAVSEEPKLAERAPAARDCEPCRDGSSRDDVAEGRVLAQWKRVPPEVIADLEPGCLCFGSERSVVVNGENAVLPSEWGSEEQAARAAHLSLHRKKPPWGASPELGCDERVQRALELEADAHAIELDVQRALGVRGKRYPFARWYFETPAPIRHRFMQAYFREHREDDEVVARLAREYRGRCPDR